MDERIDAAAPYNLWSASTFDFGYIRNEYTDRIASYTGNRLIKVLVGQRRTGKSYLLRQIARHLVENGVRPRGLRAPATPAPPFFGSPKKGGKESSPLANVPGAFARDALRLPSAPARARALRESHAQTHAQKPRRPHAPARGKKTPRRPPHKKRPPRTVSA